MKFLQSILMSNDEWIWRTKSFRILQTSNQTIKEQRKKHEDPLEFKLQFKLQFKNKTAQNQTRKRQRKKDALELKTKLHTKEKWNNSELPWNNHCKYGRRPDNLWSLLRMDEVFYSYWSFLPFSCCLFLKKKITFIQGPLICK